jgi:hypothetical protein
MDWLNEAAKLEEELYTALKSDELERFSGLLKERERLYGAFAGECPGEFREYLDSDAFKDILMKINKLHHEKKENLINEMRELARSKKASDEYIANSGAVTSVFSKSV